MLAKNLTALHFNIEIQHQLWHLQRYGWYERSYFKKPFPIGIILPFLLVWLSYPSGFLKCFTFLQFKARPSITRVSKKTGIYRFSELTELDLAWIGASGIFACLALAIIASLFNLPNLALFSSIFSIWNLLPISQLDGSKIFFGSRVLWLVSAILSIIVLIAILL